MRKALATTALLSIVAAAGCDTGPPPIPPDSPGTIPGVETRALAAQLGRDGTGVSFVKVRKGPSWATVPMDGATYLVDGERLEVVEFAYAEQAEAAARRIDPRGSKFGSTFIDFDGAPHIYQRGRLLVLYVGANARMLDRLEGALGAQVAGR